MNQAPAVAIWRSRAPMYEFLYVDDMATASGFVMNLASADNHSDVQTQLSHTNMGNDPGVTVAALAATVACIAGYSAGIILHSTTPVSARRELLDSAHLVTLGWQTKTSLEEGLINACDHMKKKLRDP